MDYPMDKWYGEEHAEQSHPTRKRRRMDDGDGNNDNSRLNNTHNSNGDENDDDEPEDADDNATGNTQLVRILPNDAQCRLRCMNSCRRNGLLCDIVVVLGAVRFSCHKIVLAAESKYFYSMFCGAFEEGHLDPNPQALPEISLDHFHFTPIAFSQLLDFLYTGICLVGPSTATEILHAADVLAVDSLKDLCVGFLQQNLGPESCLTIWQAGVDLNIPRLIELGRNECLVKFSKVVECGAFLKIDETRLIELLKNDNLHAGEEEVFTAVMRWYKHLESPDPKLLDVVLPVIRFPLMSHTFLDEHVEREPLVIEHRLGKDLLIEAYKCLQLQKTAGPRTQPRVCLKKFVYVLGGRNAESVERSVLRYNVQADKWDDLTWRLPQERKNCAAAIINRTLYVIGGKSERSDVPGLQARSLSSDDPKWENIPSRSIRCSRFQLLAFEDHSLYIIGGLVASAALKSVQRFSPPSNWVTCADMLIGRGGFGSCVLNGQLYVVGGFNGHEPLKSAERYDPVTDTWTMLPPMLVCRRSCSATAFAGKIFVFGGHDGISTLVSVECFDPLDQRWTALAPMSIARGGFGVVNVGTGILVIGGRNSSSGFNDCVELYDPHTDTWRTVSNMSSARSHFGVAYG